MQFFCLAALLFTLNLLDGLLTVFWVRNGFATEGNQLMASLLDIGDLPFLAVKIGIGAIASIVIWRWRKFPVAQHGLTLTLLIYMSVMGIHFFTGLSAIGFLPDALVENLANWSQTVLAFFF
jgi:Domain of unknown function (DUF5658)